MHRCVIHMQKKAAVSGLCSLLGICRTGIYTTQARLALPAVVTKEQVHLQAALEASGHTCGSRRLSKAMQAVGLRMGLQRTRTLMQRLPLRARWRREFKHTTNRKHELPVAENILNGQLNPKQANQAWVCDITYIRPDSGWLYLAAVLDLYSREVTGRSLAASMRAELVSRALAVAATHSPTTSLLTMTPSFSLVEVNFLLQFFAQNMGFSLHPFSDIPVQQWMTLLKHPEVIRHMPLADANWNEAAIAEWAQGKDSQWKENGYGPRAIHIDDRFAGWGGFQQEDGEADFALVLFPEYWGQGSQIFHHFMSRRTELGIESVSILLPPSRLRTRGLSRLGFELVGDVVHGGQRFLKFRITG